MIKVTVKNVKEGTELGNPIYYHKPYIVLNNDNVILSAGDLKHIKSLVGYYDDQQVKVRTHDLYMNDNRRIAY